MADTQICFYVSKIVMVPRNEFTVLFLLCLIPINLILGALNLLFYLTPLVISWGSVLFEFVVATPFCGCFSSRRNSCISTTKPRLITSRCLQSHI